MQLASLNKIPEKYGLPQEMEYKNNSFYGHQLGLCIGEKNNQNGDLKSFISWPGKQDKSTEVLEEILKEKGLLIIEDRITRFSHDTKELLSFSLYYLPYYVKGHSAYKPTINYENISNSTNIKQHVEYEVLFVSNEDDELNCYLNLTYDSSPHKYGSPCSMYDLMTGLEDELDDIAKDDSDNRIYKIKDEEGSRWAINFYDKIGNSYPYEFKDYSTLLDCVTSIRMVEYEKQIVSNEEMNKIFAEETKGTSEDKTQQSEE